MVDVGRPRATFELELAAGTWRVRAWRDLDRNRAWQPDASPRATRAARHACEPGRRVVNDLALVLQAAGAET